MDGLSHIGGGGAASLSPTSPVSARSLGGGANGGPKRKRSSGLGGLLESSPGSADEDGFDQSERKRQPGVKRACNECRQQKVSQPPNLPAIIGTLQRLRQRYHHRSLA